MSEGSLPPVEVVSESNQLLSIQPIFLGPLLRSVTAEFIGTFFLCFTIGLSGEIHADFAPFAIGGILMVMIFALGHVSGAHFNPAVTLAVFVRGDKIEAMFALCYLIAQIMASILAGFISVAILTGENCFGDVQPSECAVGYPKKGHGRSSGSAFGVELFYTFALCTVVLNAATTKAQHGNSFFGLAIGFTVLSGAIAGGPISGGAFNPAVGTGLPLAHADAKEVWIYWLGPMLGGLLAGLVFRFITAAPHEYEPVSKESTHRESA